MVTEFQLLSGVCQRCGRVYLGKLPPSVPPGVLGPRAMAVVAVLSGKYHLSKRQMDELLQDLLGIDVSLGTVHPGDGEQAVADGLPKSDHLGDPTHTSWYRPLGRGGPLWDQTGFSRSGNAG
jgi:hypothetical protein